MQPPFGQRAPHHWFRCAASFWPKSSTSLVRILHGHTQSDLESHFAFSCSKFQQPYFYFRLEYVRYTPQSKKNQKAFPGRRRLSTSPRISAAVMCFKYNINATLSSWHFQVSNTVGNFWIRIINANTSNALKRDLMQCNMRSPYLCSTELKYKLSDL